MNNKESGLAASLFYIEKKSTFYRILYHPCAEKCDKYCKSKKTCLYVIVKEVEVMSPHVFSEILDEIEAQRKPKLP